MRLLSFEEREDLCRRANGMDLLDFVNFVQDRGKNHQATLAVLLRMPQRSDIPEVVLQWVRNKLAEEGTEVTPHELILQVEDLMFKLRNFMREQGMSEDLLSLPDMDFLKILQA